MKHPDSLEENRMIDKRLKANRKQLGILPPETESHQLNYKEPLEAVEDGYGYMGTVSTNKTETHIQCHICGYFFKSLGSHISRQHKITVRDYKEKHGLRLFRGLVSPAYREALIRRTQNADSITKLKRLKGLQKGSKKLDKMRKNGWRLKLDYSLENKNENGTCPDQLLDKIKLLAKELGYTPSQTEFGRHYKTGHIEAVYRTFGSWTNAVRIAGLEPKGAGRQPMYSKQSLVNIMRDFYEKWNRKPAWADFYDRNGVPGHTTILKYFGSYSKAIQAAFDDYPLTTPESESK